MPASRRSTRRSELNERKAQSKTDQNMLYVVLGVVGALGLLIVFAVMSGDDPLPDPWSTPRLQRPPRRRPAAAP